MKKLVLFVAVFAALVSCGHNKSGAGSTTAAGNDSTAMVEVVDTTVIIDLTGNWVADSPATPAAPVMNLKADKSAHVTNVPVTQEAVKTVKTKGAKATTTTTPQQANWKQTTANQAMNDNGTLVLFSSVPGKHNTDSVVYEIVNVTDSSLTIQGEAGIFKFKKH